MTQVRLAAVIKGLATYVPVLKGYACRGSGGTVSARYCYSVWMRHLVKAFESQLSTDPVHVGELGPGDSLGVGLAALLTGADHYYALDAKPHAIASLNRSVLEEIIGFLVSRMPIPDADEFPLTAPVLDSYAFPSQILTEKRLLRALNSERLEAIRSAVRGEPARRSPITIRYDAPWDAASTIQSGRIDMLLSQAVLEHVDDISKTYRAMREWLAPSGFMSHTIDFKSHNLTHDWNGHWTIPDSLWTIIRGQRPYLLNRMPLSAHLSEIERAGFLVKYTLVREMKAASRPTLASRFAEMTDADLLASGVFLQATPVT